MAKFGAFKGVFYDDPDSSPEDGVMDVSSVIDSASSSGFAAARLVDDPSLWSAWLEQRRLRMDDEPAVYVFRAGYRDEDGAPVQTSGVFGRGTPAADVFEAGAHLVTIDNTEFDHLLAPNGLPVVTATDASGTHYRVWATRQLGFIDTISDAVSAAGECPPGLVAATTAPIELPLGLVFAASPRT